MLLNSFKVNFPLKQIFHFAPYILIISLWIGFKFGGIFLLCPFLIMFVLTPLFDLILGNDHIHKVQSNYKIDLISKIILTGYNPLYFISLLASIWYVKTNSHHVSEIIYLILSLGSIGSLAINFSHENIHKQKPIQKFIAYLGLFTANYMHFGLYHLIGHHRYACTPQDHSTAWYGENVYKYYLRTVPNCIRLTWLYEINRLNKKNINRYSLQNRMLWFLLLPFIFLILLVLFISPISGIIFLLQGFIASALLEIVSYIEHYGLLRREIDRNCYTRMNEMHSWNANQKMSNYMFLRLQLHSDHHLSPKKLYPYLRHYPDSPCLPFGYSIMIGVSLIPPLWFWIMNPRVDKIRNMKRYLC